MAILLLTLGAYMHSKVPLSSRIVQRAMNLEKKGPNEANVSSESEGTVHRWMKVVHIGGEDTTPKAKANPRPVWKYPLVDRTILKKLERMQDFFAQDYYAMRVAPPTPTAGPLRSRWPPLVTRIPERGYRPPSLSNVGIKDAREEAICESAKNPRPCRFLFPLRIAEQESKARIHFSQIVQLARELNRTLVLPNVGKSKIGACFKWGFETYYDVASLDGGSGDNDWFVELDEFKTWLEGHNRQRFISSQLVSIASNLPANTKFRNENVFANEDVVVHAYDAYEAWKADLPGCFSSRFERLELETFPVFMSTTASANRDANNRPIGNAVVDAFSAISSSIEGHDETNGILMQSTLQPAAPDPQVLVVNWDLRYPVFPSLPTNKSLQYSRRMHSLAERYGPEHSYLAVQWRMETVDPEVLSECAHALVDVLSRLLHDTTLAANITTVWFASDYPYPITRRVASQPGPAVVAKSGTFRDFEMRHEEAVEILRKAFDEQGELNRWRLTDFTESLGLDRRKEPELMQDPGVFGILDKLVSTKANLFVSGSNRCSRRSSFTKQVVDTREVHSGGSDGLDLRNVIDVFG